MAGARFDASREVRNITSPTLVIHGADDCYVPVANALAKAIPGAKLHVLEGAAHLVFIEQAEEVNKHILSFLQPRKPRRRQKPKELPTPHKTVLLFEPRRRRSQKKVLAEQKTKQLVEWIEETKKEITSSLRLPNPKGATELKEDLKIRKQQSYRSSLRKVGHSRQEVEQGKGELC